MSSNGINNHTESNGCETAPEAFAASEVTMDWANYLGKRLVEASWQGVEAVKDVLPADTSVKLLEAACVRLRQESTVVDIDPKEDGACVHVVGDTHGQLHDVLHMLDIVGYPSSSKHIIFNGDFVDRGAWGLETLIMLAALKLAAPQHVTLLRGNHESSTCTQLYGFRTELFRKYGSDAQQVYKMCKQLFAALPLAAVVGGAALVLHGGLFRRPAQRAAQRSAGGQAPPKKRKRYAPTRSNATPTLGSLEDLRSAVKGGVDPNGLGSSMVAADVLWSDPVAEPGLHSNTARGVGLIFGPNITQEFLEANNLRLILRSHEGPDARCDRDDLPDMKQGFTVDHVTPAGRLLTVFSAPDYPQFQANGQDRYQNLGAVAVLRGPEWDDPDFVQFEAVHPRPDVAATYEYNDVPGSDEEMELGLGSDASLASSCGGSELSDAMSEGERPDEASSLHPENEDHEGYARQASSAAMAATAKAVAKLKLQQGQEQDPGPASTGLPASSHACNGNGTTSSLATADSETEAEAPGPVLLNPADSGYFADTEDGLALKRPPGPAPGHRSSSLRPRSRQ